MEKIAIERNYIEDNIKYIEDKNRKKDNKNIEYYKKSMCRKIEKKDVRKRSKR